MLQVPRDMLREAIDLWLRHAYPTGELPDAVKKRINLDDSRPLSELMEELPFERYAADAPERCTVYALRLGSVEYPHLKLEIRPFPSRQGFVFWVNTHDQFVTPDVRCRDADRWRELVLRNRDLKQAIERSWAEANLPTHLTALQESMHDAKVQDASAPSRA